MQKQPQQKKPATMTETSTFSARVVENPTDQEPSPSCLGRKEEEFKIYLELFRSKEVDDVTECCLVQCTGLVKPIVGVGDDDEHIFKIVTEGGEDILPPGPIGISDKRKFLFEDILSLKDIDQGEVSVLDERYVHGHGCASHSGNGAVLSVKKDQITFNHRGKLHSINHERGFCRLFQERQDLSGVVFVDHHGDAFYLKYDYGSNSYEKIPFLPGFTEIENICFCGIFCLILTKTGRLYLSNFTMGRPNENFEGYAVVQNLKTTLKHLNNRRSCIYLQDVTQTVLESHPGFHIGVPHIVNVVPGFGTFYVSLSTGETMGYSFQSIDDDRECGINHDYLGGPNGSEGNFKGIIRFLTFSGKITGSTLIAFYQSSFLALIIDYSSLYILSLDDLESTPCPMFPLRVCDSYQLEGITKDLCCIVEEGPQNANMAVIFLLKSTGQITSVSFTDILRSHYEDDLIPKLGCDDEFFLLGATSGEKYVGSFPTTQPKTKRYWC